jgi:hypothetical protein
MEPDDINKFIGRLVTGIGNTYYFIIALTTCIGVLLLVLYVISILIR